MALNPKEKEEHGYVVYKNDDKFLSKQLLHMYVQPRVCMHVGWKQGLISRYRSRY